MDSSVIIKLLILSSISVLGAGLGLDCTSAPCKLDDESVRFFLLGDWGGEKKSDVTNGQLQCANLTRDMGANTEPQFFVSTGDNFYEWGVTDVDDPRFKHTFDDVYLYGKEDRLPWYVTLGNHDWYLNGKAQIEYTWKNDRWVSPDHAFTVSYDASPKGPTVDMIYIDTIVMCGNTWEDTDDPKDFKPQLNKTGRKTKDYVGPVDPALAEEIWKYTEEQMAKSEADYLFVVGHYPAFASDRHKTSWCLVPKLQEMMEKYSANGYLCGHAHNMQHVTTISRTSGKPIHHVLSGAARGTNANFKPIFKTLSPNPWQATSDFFYPKKGVHLKKGDPKETMDRAGLVYVDLGLKEGTFSYYKCDGDPLYSFQLQARTAA